MGVRRFGSRTCDSGSIINMFCPNCKAANDDENIFCVNCGSTIAGSPSEKTIEMLGAFQTPQPSGLSEFSTETKVVDLGQHEVTPGLFNQPKQPSPGASKAGRSKWSLITLGVILGIVVIGGGLYLMMKPQEAKTAEALPTHLGLFVQSLEKERVDEVKKYDFASVTDAKDDLSKNESLPVLDMNPSLVLYTDNNDIPVNDLLLIQLDTIEKDGNFKQIDFQAAPVDGKPAMKRMRVPDGLSNGKYAFALLGDFFNEGKHKFWAFKVSNSTKSENGEVLKTASLPMKPAPPSQQTTGGTTAPARPSGPPPSVGGVAYSTTNNLILRSGPSQSSAKIRNLARGEMVYILGYSGNTEAFKGRVAPFAQVRTSNGQVGWAFTAYLRQ